MNDAQTSRTEWVLTGEALGRLLAGLDADVEAAGEKYEALRRKLVKFFDWRGTHFPEECADETINRVIRKLESGETIRDIPSYCVGIARLVFLEVLRKPDRHQIGLDELGPVVDPSSQPGHPAENATQTCFERCLNELPAESYRLVLRYYQDEGRRKIDNRQTLAESLGIPLNALRNRVQRIRDKLEHCVAGCLGGPPPAAKK
ncbi:MAG TPA: hypothetical protein VJ302_20935 [Blastocatellia bacterium]|nr:hypothetical protein [Blastocatellia bacterium]